MDLTKNQMAILRRIARGTHSLERCTDGFALWNRDISWSQGRTPRNAITESDIESMKNLGYLVDAGFGGLKISFERWSQCFHFECYKFSPANEGYTGESLM